MELKLDFKIVAKDGLPKKQVNKAAVLVIAELTATASV